MYSVPMQEGLNMSYQPMGPDLLGAISQRLAEFDFKRTVEGWLRQGICPNCSKRELFTREDAPWVLRCGRLNHCGYEGHAKDLWPDLFTDWTTRARNLAKAQAQKNPDAKPNPNAAADLYLSDGRGFDLELIKGWYTQESYYDDKTQQGTATVRFPLCNGHWERLIDRPERFGKDKARIKKGLQYRGRWWCPPSVNLAEVKKLWIVEGIFNAIALLHHGIVAVAAISCTNYPEAALQELADLLEKMGLPRPVLVWALDTDPRSDNPLIKEPAGQRYTRRWYQRAIDQGWTCEAAQIPHVGLDWNDMHQRGRLEPDDIAEYLHHGKLLTARSAEDKALLIYNHDKVGNTFHFDFSNNLYWFKLDFDKYENARRRVEEDNEEHDRGWSDEEVRDKALRQCNAVQRISQCKPTALYFQCNSITGESWYYYLIEFPHDAPAVKDTFTSSQLTSAGEFKKRLLAIAPGALFTGSNEMLDRMVEKQLFNIKRVETIDFIGYSKEHQAYVLGDVAVTEGRTITINNEDYFEMNARKFLKSLNQSVTLNISKDRSKYNPDWPRILWRAFGVKGYVALAFWFGTLFAEQIRSIHKSMPFMEIVGEAGAGKTSLIEFLWKLLGRLDYEGFDPSKSSLAARARNFAQVANLPVVLIESDRERQGNEKAPHIRAFDWDELKTAYNGRSVRARGMATSGNETYEPPFRGAIVISQNNPVMASDAVLQRICHLYFDRSNHSATSKEAVTELERMPMETVSHFILLAAQTEANTLQVMESRMPHYADVIKQTGKVKVERLMKNHAQIMAMVEALSPLIDMNEQQFNQVQEYIISMAAERQEAINADTEVVQQFWDTFEFINKPGTKNQLDHSNAPEIIAINLNHFFQIARETGQPLPDMALLKKALKTSRRYRFVDYKNVTSNVFDPPKSVKCYVFERTPTKGSR